MSERKVLNKYYPPDFDPTKIPRARQGRNKQFTVRLMAPCNMRCTTCGEYIYKGKKFNARKEDVENENYLGIRIYRFYIKCTRCIADICFKTDPASTDYIIEAGATRNFMALKLAEEQAAREEKAEKEDEATNPMKVLEKRTQASRDEMAVLEALEELKELNERQVKPDFESMIHKFQPEPDDSIDILRRNQEEEDEAFVQSVFGKKSEPFIKRIVDESSSDEEGPAAKKMFESSIKPTDFLTSEIKPGSSGQEVKPEAPKKELSIGSFLGSKKMMLVKPKPVSKPSVPAVKNDVAESTKQAASSSSGPAGLSLLGGYGSGSSSDSD